LYTHAFVLLACAEAFKLTGNPDYLATADKTLAFLDTRMVIPGTEGYAESEPRRDEPRRQDPHMHLFEALLALHEADAGRGYLMRAAHVRDLLFGHFLVGQGPVLADLFDAGWHPLNLQDVTFEPGHHFEWVWLLDRFARMFGGPEIAGAGTQARTLWDVAIERGVRRDLWIYDRVAASGRVVAASTRLWPYAEAAKAATCGFSEEGDLPLRFLDALARRFLTSTGTWTDRLGPQGAPISEFVPASSLYHICSAVSVVEAWQEVRANVRPRTSGHDQIGFDLAAD
jgi:mannose/cellobiose epimerase-like protein (N-acyl-D-glucosamine 2-epimerase family)